MDDKLTFIMWNIILALIVLAVVGISTVAFLSPKKVDGYYLSNAQNSNIGSATCVWAHWTWHVDERAFCTNNYQEAVDFMNKANASVKQ